MNRSRRAALASAALAVAALTLGPATPAAAHVSVDPTAATQGDYLRLAFRVPNESDVASTVKVEVVLPENAPVATVTTMPVPGWTVTVERRKLDPPVEVHGGQVGEAVSKITWTAADGAGIEPGQFQEFPVSMGPLPAVDRLVLKSLQTYSDGNVVRWIEEPPVGGGEVNSPAPVLHLAAGQTGTPTPGSSPATAAAGDTDGWGTAGIVAALVAGLAGLVLGALAFARTRTRHSG